ncbi:MAG: translation elongation factor Ts [Bacteroidales bacterium]|nr:translation elongation factor Ts [Bacteroidales bacterium]
MNITASDVNKLRQMTGAGMMDCKKALQECEGDFEAAVDNLRKKGQKVASKRADRDASEGVVLARANEAKTYAAAIMVNCETDFVAKNDEFSGMVSKLMDIVMANQPKTIEEAKALAFDGNETFDDFLTNMIGKTGEKMTFAHFKVIEAPIVSAYIHQGNRLATIVGFNTKDAANIETLGHEIAMQIAAMAPVAIDRDDVDPTIVERELEIGRDQARTEGKPENMIEKIAEGKLNRFYKESTLLNQDFIRDTKKTVGQYLTEVSKDLKVTAFNRLMLGE